MTIKETLAVQRYHYDAEYGMTRSPDGFFVSFDDYQREIEAAKFEGARLAIEAAVKACDDEAFVRTENEWQVGHNDGCGYCSDTVSALSAEQILKDAKS